MPRFTVDKRGVPRSHARVSCADAGKGRRSSSARAIRTCEDCGPTSRQGCDSPIHSYDHTASHVSTPHKPFDGDKLGFRPTLRETNAQGQEAYALLPLDDVRLELTQSMHQGSFAAPAVRPPCYPHLAIETENMAQEVARLQEARVPIMRGPLEVSGEETWVYSCDPDNNMLESIQWFRNAQAAEGEAA